jgi:hypothetical protein
VPFLCAYKLLIPFAVTRYKKGYLDLFHVVSYRIWAIWLARPI